MRNRQRYGCNTSFLDLLFNMLLAFTALFVMAFAMINQNKDENKTNTEVKAEYIITISWPDDMDNDIDTYVEDPEGHLICFRRREDGLMHLDRDDLGLSNDKITTQDGQVVKYIHNREMVTLRGVNEGEYCVNVHAYRSTDPRPCEVTVQMDRLNPKFSTVYIRKVTLNKSGDEQTVVRFRLTKKGELLATNTVQKSLLAQSFGQQGLAQPPATANEFAPPEVGGANPPAPPPAQNSDSPEGP